jgi:hypothetical protein
MSGWVRRGVELGGKTRGWADALEDGPYKERRNPGRTQKPKVWHQGDGQDCIWEARGGGRHGAKKTCHYEETPR